MTEDLRARLEKHSKAALVRWIADDLPFRPLDLNRLERVELQLELNAAHAQEQKLSQELAASPLTARSSVQEHEEHRARHERLMYLSRRIERIYAKLMVSYDRERAS